MPRVLVTGAGGFVGSHALTLLPSIVKGADIVPTSRLRRNTKAGLQLLDVTDRTAVDQIVARVAPTHVLHLAGMAALPAAAANPDEAWTVHLHGTLNIANAILRHVPNCVMVHAGSGQVYGASALAGLPMDEDTVLSPTDTYTATKAAADLALGALSRAGLRCIRLRPFNHIGPGQSEDFAIASFAAQIARIKAGRNEPVLKVGNLEARRDFLDVRDVAIAYAKALVHADEIAPGTILNLASGTSWRIRDLLEQLISLSAVDIAIEVDQARLRPTDIPLFLGDAGRARRALAWELRFAMDQTLRDILASAERSLS